MVEKKCDPFSKLEELRVKGVAFYFYRVPTTTADTVGHV